MSKGKVKEYDPSRGCGIIVDANTGIQLTVYGNYIRLKQGEFLQKEQEVEYEIENRIWAVNVRAL